MGWIFQQDRPIYTQLLEQIQMRIVCGRYAPGDKLPSVRELAQEASVNPNTMQKALSELERTGLIYAQRTAGRFVTEDEQLIRECRRRIAVEKIEDFMGAMKELGYTRDEVLALMEKDKAEEAVTAPEAEETKKGDIGV